MPKTRNLITSLFALFALVAALIVVLPATAPETFSSSASAMTKACKERGRNVANRMVRDVEGGPAGPDYVTRTWFRYYPTIDGAQICRIGVNYRFPAGTNPCRLYFVGARGDFTFRPGGSKRSVVLDCQPGKRSALKVQDVNVFVSELIAPPQPGMNRILTWDSTVKAMWGKGRSDPSKKQNNSLLY